MFGRRGDGRVFMKIDPIVRFTPYIMKDRSDAQVFMTLDCDYDSCSAFMRQKKAEGHNNITMMSLIIAGYVRALSKRPEPNRFVIAKKLYVRNHMCVTFTAVSKRDSEEVNEVTIKVYFDPSRDTVFTVSDRIARALEQNLGENTADNATLKVANGILSVPLLPSFLVNVLMWADRRGMLPRALIDASPFHSSMVITNMASIKMNSVYHHSYNFGNVGMFIGRGKRTTRLSLDSEGRLKSRRVIPLGIVIDERLCAGATYAMAVHHWEYYMKHPELLETPPEPEEVRYENGMEYHLVGDRPDYGKKQRPAS